MTNIAIFTGGHIDLTSYSYDVIIGVDRATLHLISNYIPIDLAIGDFDSISSEEFHLVESKAKKVKRLPTEKDDTDTEAALKEVFNQYPKANVTIYGAFGGRLDHTLSNIFLPSNPELYRFSQQISLLDDQNHLTYLKPGSHKIKKNEKMTYISFLTEKCSNFSISNAKYDLNKDNFFEKKIYSSNEFLFEHITVKFTDGYLIVIQSKDA